MKWLLSAYCQRAAASDTLTPSARAWRACSRRRRRTYAATGSPVAANARLNVRTDTCNRRAINAGDRSARVSSPSATSRAAAANAGAVFAGPVEAYTAAEATRQFDVNIVGALRVNRAAIAHLRRQGHGALIQVTSVADRTTAPFTGLYSASKAALAALTDAWRHELAGTGVESVSVAPAAYDTDLGKNGSMPADTARLLPYQDSMGAFMAAIAAAAADGYDRDPQPVTDALVAVVEAPAGTRPHRTVIAPPGQYDAILAADRALAAATRAVAADLGVADQMTA